MEFSSESRDESITTTLRVIMDVLKVKLHYDRSHFLHLASRNRGHIHFHFLLVRSNVIVSVQFYT